MSCNLVIHFRPHVSLEHSREERHFHVSNKPIHSLMQDPFSWPVSSCSDWTFCCSICYYFQFIMYLSRYILQVTMGFITEYKANAMHYKNNFLLCIMFIYFWHIDVFVTVSFCHWQSTGQCMRSHLQQVTSLNSLVRYFTYLITQSRSVWCLLNRIEIHSPTWKRSHLLYAATSFLEHDQDFLPINEFTIAWECEKIELEYKLSAITIWAIRTM